MKDDSLNVAELDESAPESRPRTSARRLTRARLAGITPEGVVLVSWRGDEAVTAELAAGMSDQALLQAIERQAQVLIDFVDGDTDQPVILGLLRDRLDVGRHAVGEVTEPWVELTAGESLRLRCGESAIELEKDGRVVIRGVEVRSVATAGNLIQGAHVDIN